MKILMVKSVLFVIAIIIIILVIVLLWKYLPLISGGFIEKTAGGPTRFS